MDYELRVVVEKVAVSSQAGVVHFWPVLGNTCSTKQTAIRTV